MSRAVAIVGTVGLVAQVAAGTARARPGYVLTQREGKGRTLRISVSSARASVTEYAVQGGCRRAVNGAILRYGDRKLFLLRPAERKYTRIGLVSALAQDAREREMARKSQPAVAREIAEESRFAPRTAVKPPPKIGGLTRTNVTGRSRGRVARPGRREPRRVHPAHHHRDRDRQRRSDRCRDDHGPRRHPDQLSHDECRESRPALDG